MTLPPGFLKLQAPAFTVLYRAEDEAWVKPAVQAWKPATRPATMPQDLLSRVAQGRAAVEAQMRQDLALPPSFSAAPLFDTQIIPELERLGSYHVPVFYLVASRPFLRELIRSGGWSDPSFYYNRAAEEVMFTSAVTLDLTRPADDAVLPVVHDPEWDEARRSERLQTDLRNSQADLARITSGKAQYDVHIATVDFILREVFEPMKLPADQRWLVVGAAAYLSCDYAQTLTGAGRRELLAMMVFDPRQNTLPVSAVDVVHPIDVTLMRPQYVAAYNDAFRRKSILLVRKWLEKSSRESLARVLESIRKNRPADGAALIALIAKDSGVDLAADAAVAK